MTNKRIDVLAVMDALRDCWQNPSLSEARAAVAELMEAATDVSNGVEPFSVAESLMLRKLRAALARVGAP